MYSNNKSARHEMVGGREKGTIGRRPLEKVFCFVRFLVKIFESCQFGCVGLLFVEKYVR
jgi:hypothetical protein